MPEVTIIGGGLAGCEAAWQASQFGVEVKLWEMRPERQSPAHHTEMLAELVCSNSLRASSLENAVGLLKEEMRRAGSLIIECADKTQVPAGGALAVDRNGFASEITKRILSNPRIKLVRAEVLDLPEQRPLVIATGPLTSEAFSKSLKVLTSEDYLHFYDAAAPIVTKESLNMETLFLASRYEKGEAAYLNAPMNKEEYYCFWKALVEAEVHEPKAFEHGRFFEGCLPLEVIAKRGQETLRYGPLKPVGLVDPHTGATPYAVVQLRQDDREGTLYNLVGFQTQLKWGEQKRIFRMIPGLEAAEFARFGVMHQNTFLNGPRVLQPTLEVKEQPQVFFAGQITGVEGYVESAASGFIAGVNSALMALNKPPLVPPPETAHGALCCYVSSSDSPDFQPMNITFGLFPPLEKHLRKRLKVKALVDRALAAWEGFLPELEG